MSKRKSNIYHRKDGRWEGRFHISGTKKYISVYGKSYNEAKDKLEIIYTANLKKEVRCTSSFEEIAEKWIENTKSRVKESSFYCYLNKISNHIMPFFKSIKYCELSPEIIYNFIKEKFRQNLSAKYISDMIMIIKNIAKWANKVYGYCNNIINVELPKIKQKEPELLSKDEQIILQNKLVNSADSTSAGILLTMFTGIRIGELCALQWSDIDIDNKILHIRKTAQRINTENEKSKSVVRISSPKTENSVRDIPLPDFIVNKLALIRTSDEKYLLSGTNKIVEPRTLTNRFKNILKKADLPSIRFHSLRHTFATNCLQKNFDIKTLSEILGHSDISTTMKIYVHSSMERKRACMNTLALAV